MSAPHLLLVDDSQAILAYETAALSRYYSVSTASNGKEALDRMRSSRPSAVLLDLSMPVMSGDEVVARMRADPQLRDIPVIIVSSESARAEACLAMGATAYLPKPIRAEELSALVARVLAQAEEKRREHGIHVIVVVVGTTAVGLPLEAVRLVASQPATMPLPFGSRYVSEMFDLHGQPVCVIDFAELLHTTHAVPIDERKLVVLVQGAQLLALCVDGVREPEFVPQSRIVDRGALGGAEHPPLDSVLRAIVHMPEGIVPIIDPVALISPKLARKIKAWLASHASDQKRAATPGQFEAAT